jgi:hypothetical protein
VNSGTTLQVWSLTTSIVVVARLVRLAPGEDQQTDADQRGQRHCSRDMDAEENQDEAQADRQEARGRATGRMAGSRDRSRARGSPRQRQPNREEPRTSVDRPILRRAQFRREIGQEGQREQEEEDRRGRDERPFGQPSTPVTIAVPAKIGDLPDESGRR